MLFSRLIIDDCIVSSCSKFTQNALAAGAPPRTPLWELKRSPRLPSRFQGAALRQGKPGKGREGKEEGGGEGKGEEGSWERERGREGKGRGEGGKGEGGGKERGGGVCIIGVGGIDAPDSYQPTSNLSLLSKLIQRLYIQGGPKK